MQQCKSEANGSEGMHKQTYKDNSQKWRNGSKSELALQKWYLSHIRRKMTHWWCQTLSSRAR
eukprot:5880821-Amphidinium_carterae.1